MLILDRYSRIVSILAVIGLLTTACAPSTPPSASLTPPPAAPPPTPASAGASPSPTIAVTVTPVARPPTDTRRAAPEAKRGGILVRYQPTEPVSSDTHQETSALTLWPFAPIYSMLVKPDSQDDTRLVGDLAESWELKDPTQYVFHLRADATWHDGLPVTAEDVKFSLDRIVNPPQGVLSPRRSLYADIISKVDVVDPRTVSIRLKFPAATFLPVISSEWSPILPKHVIEARGGQMKADPVGSGPFKFKTWVRGARIELVRNPGYYSKDRPYLDGVMTLVISEPATQIAALRTGRVDMTAPGTRGISADEADILRKEAPNIVIGTTQALSYFGPALRVTDPPFSDIRVRKAFFLAYNQQEIIDLANPKSGVVAGIFPPTSEWSLPGEELATIPGVKEVTPADIAEAKRLMAEAGLSSGVTVNLTVRAQIRPQARAGEVIRQQMERVGIKVNVQPVDEAIFFETATKRTFKVTQVVFNQAVADPDAYFAGYVTENPTNYMGYTDKDVDALIAKQSRTQDVAERKKLVFEIQRKLLNQFLFRPYWSGIYRMAWWNHVKGFRPPITCCQTYDTFEDVWLDK